MDSQEEKILIAANASDGKRFSIYLHNLIVIGIRKSDRTYEFSFFFQQPPKEVSDLWWGSTTQLFYRCGDEDYVVEVPSRITLGDTTESIAEITLYMKLVQLYDKREEGKEIIMALNDTTQQTTIDEAQALGNIIPGAFLVEVDTEAEDTIQIYFTKVDSKDIAFAQEAKTPKLERVSNIIDRLQHKSIGTRIDWGLNPFKVDTGLLNSVMFTGKILLFPWKSKDVFSPCDDSSSDDSSSDDCDGDDPDSDEFNDNYSSCHGDCLTTPIHVDGTVPNVLSKIRKNYGMYDSPIPVRICVSLVLNCFGLNGSFSLRICKNCNAADREDED